MEVNKPFNTEDEEFVSALDEISLWSAPFALKLLDVIKYKKGINALDIGFGTGFPLIELAMRLGASSAVYGVDPWKAATRRAMNKIDLLGLRNITIIEGKAEELLFSDNFLDLIVSNNGINNVEDMPRVFSECYRTLKPGSQFAFSVNLRYSMNEFYNAFREALQENGLDANIPGLKNHIHSKRKPVAEIAGLLNAAGFVINNIYHDSFKFRYADGETFLNHYFIRLAFLPEWVKLAPKEKMDSILAEVKTRLDSSDVAGNGISLTIPFAVFDCVKENQAL